MNIELIENKNSGFDLFPLFYSTNRSHKVRYKLTTVSIIKQNSFNPSKARVSIYPKSDKFAVLFSLANLKTPYRKVYSYVYKSYEIRSRTKQTSLGPNRYTLQQFQIKLAVLQFAIYNMFALTEKEADNIRLNRV